MAISTQDIQKIRKAIQIDLIALESRLDSKFVSKVEFNILGNNVESLKEDVNIMKDMIIDIRTRLDVDQIPFIENVVDSHTEKLDDHELRITKVENHIFTSKLKR
jgi:hypothetical protein